jgi:hypothetical protein
MPLLILIIHTGEADIQQQCWQKGKVRRTICKENGNSSSLLTTVSLCVCRYSSSGFVFTSCVFTICVLWDLSSISALLILLISLVSRGLCFIQSELI